MAFSWILIGTIATPLFGTLFWIFRGMPEDVREVRVSLITSLILAFSAAVWSVVSYEPVAGGVVLIDRLTTLTLLLVTGIATCVTYFSDRYMQGSSHRTAFFLRLLGCIGAAQLLIIAGDLILFGIAWCATSIALHRLITVFPDRVRALECARKKFLYSRLGDGALVIAGVLLWLHFGTTSFAGMAQILSASPSAERTALHVPTVLLALAVLTKSAQFPFHSWLPESLDVPSPVSALMHAGIVNAGGFLLMRLHFLFAGMDYANNLLTVIGGLTAVVGFSTMITQTSVKRYLAYSTVGQMGFMIMECGLGFYALALLHMVAHALYKSYSFLCSGEAVSSRPTTRAPSLTDPITISLVALLVGIVWELYLGNRYYAHGNLNFLPLFGSGICGLIFISRNLGSSVSAPLTEIVSLVAIVAAMAGIHYCALGVNQEWLLGDKVHLTAISDWAALLVTHMFIALLILQLSVGILSQSTSGRSLLVHIYNGFYLGDLSTSVIRTLLGKGTYSTVKR